MQDKSKENAALYLKYTLAWTHIQTNMSTYFYVTLQITHKKKKIYATHFSEMWKKR